MSPVVPTRWRPSARADLARADLAPGDVDVWLLDLDASVPEGVLDPLLQPAERDRAARFLDDRARTTFRRTRAALRVALSRYLGTPAATVPLTSGPYGKLAVEGSPLAFNVSHAGRYALLAFARDQAVGVDLERRRPLADGRAVARRVFTPAEQHALEAEGYSEAGSPGRLFFVLWARKEAVLKAIGSGLTLPAAGFEALALEGGASEGAPLRVTHDYPDASTPRSWHVYDLPAPPGYAAALATHRPLTRVRCLQWAWDG